MEWQRREDRRQNDMAHGINFIMYERKGENIRSEVATLGQKIHVDGVASVTLAQDQHKYGDELIVQLYTRSEPQILERRADGWNRAQIYCGPADLGTAMMLNCLAWDILFRLRSRGA